AFSPDGKQLAVGGKEEQVQIFSTADGSRSFQLEGHSGAVLSLDFSSDGKQIVSGGADGTVRLWEGKKAKHVFQAGAPVYAVDLAPDGKRLAAGADDGTVRVWDPRSGKLVKKIEAGQDAVLALAFSPHRTLLVAAGRDQVIRVFRTDSGALRSL